MTDLIGAIPDCQYVSSAAERSAVNIQQARSTLCLVSGHLSGI